MKEKNLLIGYDSVDMNDTVAQEVASRITTLLTESGFSVDWSGDLNTRIEITEIDWKKLPDGIDYNYTRIFNLLNVE